MNLFNPTAVAHRFVRSIVEPGDCCIDATVGNGHDTCFLARLVGAKGQVLGFDVQESAIQSCQSALEERDLEDCVELLHQGHQSLSEALAKRTIPSIKVAMFNLGYLPGSDKSVVTKSASTLSALEQSVQHLSPGGAVSVVAYRGHAGGNEEALAVENWVQQLDESKYFCVRYERWSKERGLTPVFIWVLRV